MRLEFPGAHKKKQGGQKLHSDNEWLGGLFCTQRLTDNQPQEGRVSGDPQNERKTLGVRGAQSKLHTGHISVNTTPAGTLAIPTLSSHR